MLVLSLCDFSRVWSGPYAEAGHKVVCVDTQYEPGERVSGRFVVIGADVTKYEPDFAPDIVLAAPPCTCFCRPAARWWRMQDASGQTAKDIATFRACLELGRKATRFFALENPPGRHVQLITELGPPSWQYQPWEYGDPWGKQTYIWGTASKPPVTAPVEPAPTRRTPNGKKQGRIAFMSSSWKRAREQTPAGFARAFYSANN